MAYEAYYAGVALHEQFKVLSIQRTLVAPRENFTKEIPSINGKVYTGYKYGARTITLNCAITAIDKQDYADQLKNIAYILDVKEPSKLILSDNPNCYYYAVIDGEIDIERVQNIGKFEIPFVCYDPIAYAIEDEEFYANQNKVVKVTNGGTTEAYPRTSVVFSKSAYFLQCTNPDGETVLVGAPVSVSSKKDDTDTKVLNDHCTSVTNWVNVGNVLDAGREVTGSLVINGGGFGLTAGSISGGTAGKWYGGALRRNIGTEVQDFKVEVKLQHNSKGDTEGVGAGNNSPTTSGDYKVTADPSLRVRSGRGTNFDILGSYKKNTTIKITSISSNWGKVDYNGKTGYVCMDYVKKITTSTSTTTNGNYKVNTKDGLNLRSGRGTNYTKLTAIPYNTTVSVSSIKDGWGKITYGGKTGYSAMQYLTKVSTEKATSYDDDDNEPSVENQVGIIEVYGFDRNGNKLFKFKMIDEQQYYEYSEPEIEFGSTLILDDNKKCPAPKTVKTKTDDDKVVTEKVDSGKYGDWNEMLGWFTLQRKTVKGKQQWYAKVEKLDSSGKVIKKIETQKVTGNYPTGALSNIVVFIGQYDNEPMVEVMNVREVWVTNLSPESDTSVKKPIFRKNDELILDHGTQKIYKNGQLLMNELDIGSQFFSVPVGNSKIKFKSDDTNIDVITAIQERWV